MTNLRTGLLALTGAVLTMVFALFLATAAFSQTQPTVRDVVNSFATLPGVVAVFHTSQHDHLNVDVRKMMQRPDGADCTIPTVAADFHQKRGDELIATLTRESVPEDRMEVFLSRPTGNGSRLLILANFLPDRACLRFMFPVLGGTAS